jgi:hypothetical protein
LANTVQLTIAESLQSTLIHLFSECGFGEIATPILTLGVQFQPVQSGPWNSELV